MVKEVAFHTLKTLLPKGQVFTDRASLVTYEVDAGGDKGMPEGVVFPRTPDEVARVVRWAAEHNVPLVARGAGTGLSGGAVADRGGIIVEFSQMNQVLDVDVDGRSAVVEPALINLRLDERVKTYGLYFPPDPASQRASTIGGNVAENSGGPHCFKYGVTTNYITGMEVVLADGRRARVGGHARDYPEYDLCGLITGSEGMLAIMTSIIVRLVRNPPGIRTMLAVFDSVEQAGEAVSAVIAAGLVPATMEMMDQKIVSIIEPFAHAGLPQDAGAVLIIEVDGYPESLDTQAQEITHILQQHGGYNMRTARDEEERAKIWLARKSAAGAMAHLSRALYTVDVTVPRSRLAEMLAAVNQICADHGLRVGHVFHAGDGNLHPIILIPNPHDPELMEHVHTAAWELVKCCIEMDGSLSGEHGVGTEKRQYMPLMHTPAELLAMWDIKQAFDPANILNPGKLFPLPSENETGPFAGYSLYQPATTQTNNQTFVGTRFTASSSDLSPAPPSKKIFTPATAEEAAEGLLSLAKSGHAVYISNAEQQQSAPTLACLLRTNELNGIKMYAPDDLYITVAAGTPLSKVQSFLAQASYQVALAAPWPDATIGGLVAANINAPLRIRYGSLRDLVLCATVVLADGRIIRTGRPIVKNVAGYDLTKAFIGSHGTLGLLTDITLKIVTQPRTKRTLLIPVDDMRYGLVWARQLLPLALTASAIVLSKGYSGTGIPESSYILVYTAEGLPEDVQAELVQVRQTLQVAGAPEPVESASISGSDIWVETLRSDLGASLQVRVGIPVRELPAYVQDQTQVLNEGNFIADIGNGLVYALKECATVQGAQTWLEKLRRPALAIEGYACIMDAPTLLQGKLDRWGYQPQALDIMRRLKARWDPDGILNRGEFIV
ncbi:MAG TPA: FAD-linked oxidase C-terminal domain-containing protein [Ktedonosporobacter sp.]|jgi:D-lactate dehydrogenase (cytochrome)|nr:FAD-linked oxidase C-terminal domain-containing protein [Ktedonosporobacter sp.]